MLSGHTHGGQIWPFGYLVRARYPLLEGRYQVKDTTVIVCRGTRTWGPLFADKTNFISHFLELACFLPCIPQPIAVNDN